MAPNKKKKKAASNPARGFATVSMPSKKVDESSLEQKNSTELPSIDEQPVSAETDVKGPPAAENGALQIHNMTPEELEQHLAEAELESLLDLHGQRSKRDISRQIARLETERRSLRHTGIVLETESWLLPVLDEILELARMRSPELKGIKTVKERPNDTDLCVKLWTVQEALKSLHFCNVEGALRHLIALSSVIPRSSSNYLIWGLGEALDWLALHSVTEDLPAYQQRNPRYTPPASRPRSPLSACTSKGTIDTPDSSVARPYDYLPSVDDADPGASSSTSESHLQNPVSNTNPQSEASEDSDDNDPDQLIDKYLSAKHELWKRSQNSKGNYQEIHAGDQQANRLSRRIQRIERDVLFDRDEARMKWNEVREELEVEHARADALARRNNRTHERSDGMNGSAITGSDFEESEATTIVSPSDEDLFGCIFASNETSKIDSEPAATVIITLRDFGPLGGGARPRKVLEDVCKAR
jgi:ATP-dependent RNA helicase DHX29